MEPPKDILQTITANLSCIAESTSVVSNYINDFPHQTLLLADGKRWNMVVSSIWVLGDTDLSISSYLRSVFPSDDGLKYLMVYGLLQALFLQQDAVTNLSDALKITIERDQRLQNVRNVRNLSSGHPTHLERKKQSYFGYISRGSLSQNGFDIIQSQAESMKNDFMSIDVFQLILDQTTAISEKMDTVAKTLKERHMEHIEKHKQRSVSSLLPETMNYYFEKINQGIFSPGCGNADFALRMLNIVKEQYRSFQEALVERQEWQEHIEYDFNTYLHATESLDRYLKGENPSMTARDARIYSYYITEENRHFQQIAKEIDQKYK
jgi:hypothetical protein